MPSFYHMTLDNKPSDAEVNAKAMVVTAYLKAVQHIGGIDYYQGPFLENRDGVYSFVYHYRWPDMSMHTTVLPVNGFDIAYTPRGESYMDMKGGTSEMIVRLPRS